MSVTGAEAKSWAREAVMGLWTSPMVTFNDEGGVDHEGIRHNVEYLLACKVDGMGFGFSELWYLTLDERMAAFETLVSAVGGRVPCYLHALDYSVPQTIELANHARAIGADAVMWWVPMEFSQTEENCFKWFETVCGAVDMPIFAYNTYHSGRNLQPETLERIAALENVCAIKDAVNDFAHCIEVFRRVGDQVVVSNPLEEYLPTMLLNTPQQVLLGATSVYLMQSPSRQPIREYVDAISRGDAETAWRLYYGLKPLRDLWTDAYRTLWVKEAATHPIPTIKAWMDLAGMRGGGVRAPLQAASQEEQTTLISRLVQSGWADELYPDRTWGTE